jgi:RHS repeat-associated protein
VPAAPDYAPSLAASERRRPPQTATQKNSRRVFFSNPSGRTLDRRHLPLRTAPGYRACGYKTASGRPKWLSRDPLGEYAGIDIYGYVLNDPVNGIDPFGLCVYYGGSRKGTGHFWAAVDLPDGSVLRYDYSALSYNGGFFSSFGTLSTRGQVQLRVFPNIRKAAGSDEYYGFPESAEADNAVVRRMEADGINPPHYSVVMHNCVDGSCEVTGRPGLGGGAILPQQGLDSVAGIGGGGAGSGSGGCR